MNKTMTMDEIIDVIRSSRFPPLPFPNLSERYYTAWGKRVIMPRFSDIVVLFEQCEYCGGAFLDKNDCCIHCGAPAYR